MAYHSNKQNNEENPYNDRQESGDVRTRYKFDENSWRRFSHNTNNSHKWNEKYQGQDKYQSKRAQSSQSNNYGWHTNHHNNNNNAYGHGNNRFGKNYTKYNKHNNNNNNNNEKSNAGNGNWNGNNRREKEEKDDFFIALNDNNNNDKLNQFCVQKSILSRKNDTFMKQLHYISSQFYLIDFVGINVNTNSKDKNASVNIRYKDENGQKMIPNSLRQDAYDDSNFYFDNANEFMKNVFDMSQTIKELKESNITWNDVFEQNGKISNEWKLDNLDNAFLRESFSVVKSGQPTYTMCIQKAINELYNHIRENQNDSQNDEKNENCEKFENIDIITTRQPLRRMVDFLLWKKPQSNPKFIIIKQNVNNNNNNNNKSKSNSKSILQFYPIWDELEQINEQKYNEKMFGKKKNCSNGTAFGKLFYGDMLERCMAEKTKDKKISLKEWIKEYNYKRKEECGESIKALSILSFLKNSQQSINILLLNEIDMIIPYKDSGKFSSDYQRCELKAMVNGYHAGQMLDHFGQAKLSGNDFVLAGIRTAAHGNGKNNDGMNNEYSYLDTLKTIECYSMNDLLIGAQSSLPREYQNDRGITVNEQFIDNVYYSILQWIIDNTLKNEQIKDCDCILCDYNKLDETLYLKPLPQVTEQLSKIMTSDKNESFGFLCDTNTRKIVVKSTNKVSVNLNDLENEAKVQNDEMSQLENLMNRLDI